MFLTQNAISVETKLQYRNEFFQVIAALAGVADGNSKAILSEPSEVAEEAIRTDRVYVAIRDGAEPVNNNDGDLWGCSSEKVLGIEGKAIRISIDSYPLLVAISDVIAIEYRK